MFERFTHNPYVLANMTDTGKPDTNESPGAVWLVHIADAAEELAEEVRDARDLEDAVHECADQLVPVYTHEMWQVFVDLTAYNEEDESGLMAECMADDAADMTRAAMVALYQIAYRLLTSLLESVEDDEDDEEEA